MTINTPIDFEKEMIEANERFDKFYPMVQEARRRFLRLLFQELTEGETSPLEAHKKKVAAAQKEKGLLARLFNLRNREEQKEDAILLLVDSFVWNRNADLKDRILSALRSEHYEVRVAAVAAVAMRSRLPTEGRCAGNEAHTAWALEMLDDSKKKQDDFVSIAAVIEMREKGTI